MGVVLEEGTHSLAVPIMIALQASVTPLAETYSQGPRALVANHSRTPFNSREKETCESACREHDGNEQCTADCAGNSDRSRINHGLSVRKRFDNRIECS